MSKKIRAIFENGIFKPLEHVDLQDKVEVELELRVVEKELGWPDGYFESTAGAFVNEKTTCSDQETLIDRDKR